MKIISALILVLLISSCGSIKNYRNIDQPTNEILTTSVGGTIFRLNRTGDLPNAFGGADIYGGKIDRGYAEVKFKGINSSGDLVIQVIDAHKRSSETTMDRYKPSPTNNINQNINIGGSNIDEASTFNFDLNKEKELIIAGIKIIFISAKPYSVTYKLIDVR